MEKLPQTQSLMHKTCGLLNFLGGSFNIEDLDNKSFSEVVDALLCNGGDVHITISKSFIDRDPNRN